MVEGMGRGGRWLLGAIALVWMLVMGGTAAIAAETPVAYIISPLDGAMVQNPVRVQFGLKGMGIAPAGVDVPNTGHHHLLIDQETLPDLTLPLPATNTIRHFGGGQTEAELTLPAGTHTLRLLLGNAAHIPQDPPVLSAPVTITVE